MKINYLFVGMIILSVVVFGCTPGVLNNSQNKDALAQKELQEQKAMEGKTNDEKKVMESEEAKMMEGYSGKILAGTVSPYIEFNNEDYQKALKENKKILLYFYASWCQLCKAEQPNTFAAFNELKYPNLVGFRVNYKDSDTDSDEANLAKEFGIAYQHTKVILKNGKQAAKFPDSWDKQRYLDELAKV